MLPWRTGRAAFLFVLAAATFLLPLSGAIRRSESTASQKARTLDPMLHGMRGSVYDLEVGGELTGLPAGSIRYLTREDLLSLPQVSYTVTDDPNFAEPVRVSGVEVTELVRRFGSSPQKEMAIVICDDKYRAHYSGEYMRVHRPFLVLKVNGESPANWPKAREGGADIGPFLISHPKLTPASRGLAHEDEAQIPWGVIRLEFRAEDTVLGAIAPRGPHANDRAVQTGLRIAEQNCFRCHNMGSEGGEKSGVAWPVLASVAAKSPQFFAAYVRDPGAQNPRTQMAGSPGYDDATIAALEAYFQTFVPQSSLADTERGSR